MDVTSKPHSELIAQFERELIAARIDNARLQEQYGTLREDAERVIAAWYGTPGMLKTSMGKLRQTLAASSPASRPT